MSRHNGLLPPAIMPGIESQECQCDQRDSRVAHTLRLEAVKKSTASRKGAKAQRKASSNSFNFFACLCGFAPLREIFWLGAHFFHIFIVPCVRPAAVAYIAKSSDVCATRGSL